MQQKTALLLIDTQVNMFTPEPVHDGEALLARLAGLLDSARRVEGTVIIYVQNNGGPGEPDAPDTPGWLIHPALAALAAEPVLQKERPDAFAGTGLQATLDAAGVQRLVIAGNQSEFCIDTTVRAASSRGYDVILVADGHSTYDGATLTAVQIIAHHNDSLDNFAQVLPAAAVDFGATPAAVLPALDEAFSVLELAQIDAGLREMEQDAFRYHHPVHALNTLRLAWDTRFVPPVFRLAPPEWHVGVAETGLLRRLRRLPVPLQRIVGAEVTAVAQKLLKAALQSPDAHLSPITGDQSLWQYQSTNFRVVFHQDQQAKRLTLLALADRPPVPIASPLDALKKSRGLP